MAVMSVNQWGPTTVPRRDTLPGLQDQTGQERRQLDHWRRYHAEWWRIQPPLRPDPDVVDAIRRLAGGRQARVRLLGVTPELANAFDSVEAIDKSPTMIGTVWPGDSATRTAVLGDWLQMEPAARPFDAVVGDGSLSNVSYPHEVREVLLRSCRSLRPAGRLVFRLFERPDVPIAMDELRALAAGPAPLNFHAFKWKLAMHLAGVTSATIPVREIRALFDAAFADRDGLADRTGWPRPLIDTIDMYRDSDVRYTFMTRAELLAVLPEGIAEARLEPCGHYDLAEACPLLCLVKS